MPSIEFSTLKSLKLTNVLSRKVPSEDLLNQNKHIQMLTNWIMAKGYEAYGPLIFYSSGIKGVDGDGHPIVDSSLMVQLRQSNVRLELPYAFSKEVRVRNCLYARFKDNAEKLQFATNKLTLYAYENDIELTGETYIIIMEQNEQTMFADVFMPIKAPLFEEPVVKPPQGEIS